MSEVKLHLGCGRRYLKGYVHIDLNDFDHIDHKHDIRTLPMFENGSVDLIYSCHSLEYFDAKEAVDVLKEWHRVLKKGGILRLAVPDFEALIQVYQKTKDLNKILGPLYGRWPLNNGKKIFYHKTVYDFASLKDVLTSVRFRNVQRWDWRKVFVGENAGFDDFSQAYFPHMDKKNGLLISLNVEATKS